MEKGQIPEDHIIYITGIKIVGGKKQLEMTKDGDVDDAHKNDTITWIIEPGSGVKEIQYSKKAGDDVFKDKPAKIQGSENWKGKIKDRLDKQKEEEDYTLYFITTNGDKGDHDPKISVNN